jgi:hypothetical protein
MKWRIPARSLYHINARKCQIWWLILRNLSRTRRRWPTFWWAMQNTRSRSDTEDPRERSPPVLYPAESKLTMISNWLQFPHLHFSSAVTIFTSASSKCEPYAGQTHDELKLFNDTVVSCRNLYTTIYHASPRFIPTTSSNFLNHQWNPPNLFTVHKNTKPNMTALTPSLPWDQIWYPPPLILFSIIFSTLRVCVKWR